MKKKLLILVSILVNAFSCLKAQDTIIVTLTSYNIPDTVNYGYIFPEVMGNINCYDSGYHDPIMGFSHTTPHVVSRLTCEDRPLKAVAQGFKFDEPTAIDGTYNIMGVQNGSSQFQVPPAGFKMGVMDSSFNIIYEKEYLIDYNNGSYWGVAMWFTPVPFDSTLYLNDFVYIYFEWPDSSCVGGLSNGYLYQDDEPAMYLVPLVEDRPLGSAFGETECALCDVKYDPLFMWYGSNSWEALSDLRCDLTQFYAYRYEKDGHYVAEYYPPIGVTLYYTNNNSGDNGGDDNGGNDEGGNNNDDNNEGGGESGLSDIDVSHLVSISPNPADDILKIQSSFKVREIEIHNALGQVVLRKEGSQNIETIDVSNLQSGTYIVRIKTQRGFANKKIVIR